MKAKNYIPTTEDALKPWLLRIANLIDTYASALNLTPAMVAALKAEAASAAAAMDEVIAIRLVFASKIAAKDSAVMSALHLFRNQIGAMKRQPGYTDAIGEALGVITPSPGFDPNTFQAQILGAVNSARGGQVKLRFSKAYGYIDGVNLYVRLQGETEWRFAGFRSVSPCVDKTPLAQPGVPEGREYCARAVIRDEEIGLLSDIVQVTVS